MLCQGTAGVQLRHQPQADQYTVERATHFALRGHGAVKISSANLADANEDVAKTLPGIARRVYWVQGRLKGHLIEGV